MLPGIVEGANAIVKVEGDEAAKRLMPAVINVKARTVNLRDAETGKEVMQVTTSWYPLPTELGRLNEGASVVLNLFTFTKTVMPMTLHVGGAPDDGSQLAVTLRGSRMAWISAARLWDNAGPDESAQVLVMPQTRDSWYLATVVPVALPPERKMGVATIGITELYDTEEQFRARKR